MKILVLANNDVGLYQFRKELLEELLSENDVYISLPNGELVQPLIDIGCQFLDTPVDRRGVNPLIDIGLIKKYFSMMNRIRPELVITYTIKPNIYGGIVCRLRRTPYAVNITGLGTAFQKKGMLRTLVTTLYKWGCKGAKVVFFENEENRQIFIHEKIVQEKQTILLNGAGVNLEHYQLLPFPEDNQTTRFLFVGRVMKEKGIDELFGAMQMLRSEGYSCHLDVLGGYEENYADIIKKYESEGWLTYHGYQKDVRPFIVQSHCFVLPSWHEGMANTNLECAASGRPVITSNIHGCLEAVEDGETGFLCEKQNIESLACKMRMLLGMDIAQRKAMGLKGRKRMEAIFDKKKVVQETIDSLR